MDDQALTLATWVRARAAAYGPVTHLKLQKLAFYCYGAALAHDLDGELGVLRFEPWTHGPVNRPIWRHYRQHGGAALPPPPPRDVPAFTRELQSVLADTIDVYGRMSAWALRCESHLERPWAEAYERQSGVIADDVLRAHFDEKFAPDHVQLPVHLGGSASAALDFIPPARFPSLHAMAETLRRRSQP